MKRTYIHPNTRCIAMRSHEHLLVESNESTATTTVGGKPGSFDVKAELGTLPWQ